MKLANENTVLQFSYNCHFSGGMLTTRPFIDRFFHEEWMRQSLAKQDIICRYVSFPIQLLNSAYTLAALPSFVVATLAFSRRRGYRLLLLLGASVHLVGHTFQFRVNIRFLIASRIFIGAGVGIVTLVSYLSHPNFIVSFCKNR